LKKRPKKKNESEIIEQREIPFEEAVRRLLQTPPIKKPKPKEKKDS
jgi:hypothetical protein